VLFYRVRKRGGGIEIVRIVQQRIDLERYL